MSATRIGGVVAPMSFGWIAATLLGVAWWIAPQDPPMKGGEQDRLMKRGVEARVTVTSKDPRPFDIKDWSARLIIDRMAGAKEEYTLTYVPFDKAEKPPMPLEDKNKDLDKDMDKKEGMLQDKSGSQVRDIEGTPYQAELVLARLKDKNEPVKPRTDEKGLPPKPGSGPMEPQDPDRTLNPAAKGYFKVELPNDSIDTIRFQADVVFKIKNETHTARGFRWPNSGLQPSGDQPFYEKYDEDVKMLESQIKSNDLQRVPATVDRIMDQLSAEAKANTELMSTLRDIRNAGTTNKKDQAMEALTRLKGFKSGGERSPSPSPSPSPSASPSPSMSPSPEPTR